MFSMFDALQLFTGVAGLMTGASLGTVWHDCWGGLLGAFAGFLAGLMIGRLPALVAASSVDRQFRHLSEEQLRRYLRGPSWFLYHHAFAELASRGADLTPEVPVVVALLRDADPARRRLGATIVRRHYPRWAAELSDTAPPGALRASQVAASTDE